MVISSSSMSIVATPTASFTPAIESSSSPLKSLRIPNFGPLFWPWQKVKMGPLTVSPMGFGTWAWGNQLLWGYQESMDGELQQIFNLAVENGINLFDTADSYGTGKLNGQSEKLLGRFIRQKQVTDNIVIATKFAAYPWRLTPGQFVNACKYSLDRMQIEQIGIGQLHWSTANYAPLQERALWDGLVAMYDKGLVQAVGVSNYGPNQLVKIHEYLKARGVPLCSAQVQFSLLSMGDDQMEIKSICDSLGIRLISYSPLGLGMLTGKYTPSNLPRGPRGLLFKQIIPGLEPLFNSLSKVAKRRRKTIPQVAINWCICKSTIPIPGAKTVKQAKENLGALGWYLSSDELLELEYAARQLRRILDSPGVHQGPACFDALSAKLVERAGFELCFTSGFSISASRLGLPDTGFISYGEMVDQGLQITQAVSIPVIGDGDNGYGNAMNVKRTVKGYIKAGFAGILLEDQVSPKACGHTRGRKVVSRAEAVMRIKAAVDARKESGSDIVIVARTDSRQAISLEESLWRSKAFADAGADVLFTDALASKEEMKTFCEISSLVPKMANMLEGGGKTPILNPMELEDVGFKLVAYPLSLMGVSIRAIQDALAAIKGGRIPPPGSMPSFEELQEILGFNSYYEEEKRYATSDSQLSSQRASSQDYNIQRRAEDDTEKRSESSQDPVVEVLTPEVYSSYNANSSRDPFSGIWSRKLRVRIVGRDGFEKLDVRIPAGFLDGIPNIVPALGGVNIKALLDDAALEEGGKLLLEFTDSGGDRTQLFLE